MVDSPHLLSDLSRGQSGVIRRVGGQRALRRRLMELGFVPGTEVRLVNVAPLGDPLEFALRGARMSMRREEARAVELEPPRRHLEVVP